MSQYRQTSNILPLAFGLVPDEHVDEVVANLVDNVVASDDATLVEEQDGYALYTVGSGEWRFVVTDDPARVCVDSDPRSTVVIGDVDSGVPNRIVWDLCTINDVIDDEGEWSNKGRFVQHVNAVLRDLHRPDLVGSDERGRITSAAARSTIGLPAAARR